MKRYYRYLTIAALAAIVAGCMEFLSINHPETAPVNTGVDATFDVKIKIAENIGSPHDSRGRHIGPRGVENGRERRHHLHDQRRLRNEGERLTTGADQGTQNRRYMVRGAKIAPRAERQLRTRGVGGLHRHDQS